MPALAQTNSTEPDGDEDVPPILELAVLRPIWADRAHRALLPDGYVRDLLHGTALPSRGGLIRVSHLTNEINLDIVRRVPDCDEHSIASSTRVYLCPSLPPSLLARNVGPDFNQRLDRFTEAALRGGAIAPTSLLLLSPYGSENASSRAVASAAAAHDAALIRFHASQLGLSIGPRGVSAALRDAVDIARCAAPAVLLIDSVHLLAPPALPDLAAGAVLALQYLRSSVADGRVALVLCAAPDARAVHARVCDEVDLELSLRPGDTAIVSMLASRIAEMRIDDSACRENRTWDRVEGEVGAVANAKRALMQALLWRRTRGKSFARLGVTPPSGVLLYGPPGTGKTLVAREASRGAKFDLLPVDAARLARGEVGESERALRSAFEEAARRHPCVLFIDEIDAMFTGGGGGAGSRLVAVLAREMDSGGEGVVVVAATNRPWKVSKSLLRAGRFDRCVHTPLPDRREREQIAEVYAKKMGVANEVAAFLRKVVAQDCCAGFSGADIAGACRKAAMRAVANGKGIEIEDVREAFASSERSVKPGVADEIAKWTVRGR